MAHVESVEPHCQLSPSAAVIVGLPCAQRSSNGVSLDFFNTLRPPDFGIDSRFIHIHLASASAPTGRLSEAASALVVCQELLKAGLFKEGQPQEFYAKVFLLNPTHGGNINTQ